MHVSFYHGACDIKNFNVPIFCNGKNLTLFDTLLVMFLDMTLNVLLLCIFCIYYSLIFACFICCSPVFYNFFSFFMFASMYIDEYFHRHD